jgi:uncharacterized protein (DUF2062 family)
LTRRIRLHLWRLLRLKEPPERTALAYGLGVFLGFSPFLGVHIVLAFLVILLFKMNRLAIFAGVFTNTPWTVAPAATLGTALGFRILGTRGSLPAFSHEKLFSAAFLRELMGDIDHLLLPFIVGNLVLATAAGVAGYLLARFLLIRYRRPRGSDSVSANVNG